MAEIAQTADHALRILEELGHGKPLTAAQLADRLQLNRTVIHRLLQTLSARSFVLRHGTLYRPGIALARLARLVEPSLREIADPIVRALSDKLEESVVLHVPDGSEAVVLHQAVSSAHVVQVSHKVGARHPLQLGASGRAILAFLPETGFRRTDGEPADKVALDRKLEAVRQMRYALSHDELQFGVHGIAVPILDQEDVAIGSLAVLVPAGRAHDLERYLDPLWQAAGEIGDGFQDQGTTPA